MDVLYWQTCKGETMFTQVAVPISEPWYLSWLTITFGIKCKWGGWCLLCYQLHIYLSDLCDIYWNVRNPEWLKISLIWSLCLGMVILGHVPSQPAKLKDHWQFGSPVSHKAPGLGIGDLHHWKVRNPHFPIIKRHLFWTVAVWVTGL